MNGSLRRATLLVMVAFGLVSTQLSPASTASSLTGAVSGEARSTPPTTAPRVKPTAAPPAELAAPPARLSPKEDDFTLRQEYGLTVDPVVVEKIQRHAAEAPVALAGRVKNEPDYIALPTGTVVTRSEFVQLARLSNSALEIGNLLPDLERSEEFIHAWLDYPSETIEVAATNGKVPDELLKLSNDRKLPIEARVLDTSRRELEEIRKNVIQRYGNDIVSVGLDLQHGLVKAKVIPGAVERRGMKDDPRVQIEEVSSSDRRAFTASRPDDNNGGTGYRAEAVGPGWAYSGPRCVLGFHIWKSGQQVGLTAGHCASPGPYGEGVWAHSGYWGLNGGVFGGIGWWNQNLYSPGSNADASFFDRWGGYNGGYVYTFPPYNIPVWGSIWPWQGMYVAASLGTSDQYTTFQLEGVSEFKIYSVDPVYGPSYTTNINDQVSFPPMGEPGDSGSPIYLWVYNLDCWCSGVYATATQSSATGGSKVVNALAGLDAYMVTRIYG